MSYLNDFHAMEAGQRLAELLGLKADKNDRYKTSYGDKTAIGLARCVERVLNETNQTMVDLLGE